MGDKDNKFKQKIVSIIKEAGRFENDEALEIKLDKAEIEQLVEIVQKEIATKTTYTRNVQKGIEYLLARLNLGLIG